MILRYSNNGTNLGALPVKSGSHVENLDGTDRVEITTDCQAAKRDRLVWQDQSGIWREHMVDSVVSSHQNGSRRVDLVGINSIAELRGIMASGTMERGSVQSLLQKALESTRWTAGTCDGFGTVEVEFWNKSVRQVVEDIRSACGGELETQIIVGEDGVTTRKCAIVQSRGSDTVKRQFTYSRNMRDVRREEASDDVYTSILCYGAPVEGDDAEYPVRLCLALHSDADLDKYGTYYNGVLSNTWMTYTDDACTDEAFLSKQGRTQLDVFSKPVVNYQFQVAGHGDWSDVRLGDKVSCVDEILGIELIERVTELRRYFNGRNEGTISIGKRANPMVEKFKAQEKTTKVSTGNSTRSYSSTPVSTRSNGITATKEGWVHQVNGVTQARGTINFVTSGGSNIGGNVLAWGKKTAGSIAGFFQGLTGD